VDGRHIPEHIPWEFEEDVFAPIPWIPEGSLVSENVFYEVRRAQRPKSCSPPQTPPAGHDVPPLDTLPFPAIIPSSAGGPTLKRAVSFHPGGSQRLRREALVIDGKITIDTGFKLRSRSPESIVPSSSEPNNMDPIVRQLDAGHQSGLERLKISMLRLMRAQSQGRSSTVAKEGKHPEVSFSTTCPSNTKDIIAEGASRELLAVRRGLPVPSTLKLTSTLPPPPASPYHPDIPTPFRGSPSAATPLFEATGFLPTSAIDKRESINVEDMCTNLRSLVSPVISKSAEEETTLSQSCCPAKDPISTSDDVINDTLRTPIEDWTFASELEVVYGGDPFSYFNAQERMPSFIRPLSVIPDIVTESTEIQRCSCSPATSVSIFPEPPAGNPTVPPIPYIAISGGGPAAENPTAQTRLSFSSSATTSGQDLMDSGDGDGMDTCVTVDLTDTSPRSSQDKDEPLAIRRLTLLAHRSAAIPGEDYLSSVRNFKSSPSSCGISPAQGTLNLAAKIVRFAPETEEHTYLTDPVVTYLPPNHQRPRSSSVPPPQKGSLRNQAFLQRDECKDGRLSRSQPITFPSRIPKKRIFPRIGLSGRHTALGQISTEALSLGGGNQLTLTGLEHANEGRKRLPSLIPVPGLKASSVPSSPDRENADCGRRVTGRNSRLYVSLKQPSRTPTPQPSPPQKTPLATSLSMTLRQYVKGGDKSGEKRQATHSPSPRHHGELGLALVSPLGKDDRKSLLPVKKASFFRDGVSKVTSVREARHRAGAQGLGIGEGGDIEVKIIGSVDKTGGISYIAPPKGRATPQSRGRVDGERQDRSTVGTKTLRPVQIRNFLGRLTA
jgi:hypothetical protein